MARVCFFVGIHIQRLLTFQSAFSFRDVPSSQNMSASFTNICSVGAVSTATEYRTVYAATDEQRTEESVSVQSICPYLTECRGVSLARLARGPHRGRGLEKS